MKQCTHYFSSKMKILQNLRILSGVYACSLNAKRNRDNIITHFQNYVDYIGLYLVSDTSVSGHSV